MVVKYKMVFADFDGTTTNSKGQVTARTRATVKRYRDAGGIFIVNTGRSYLSTVNRLRDIYGDDIPGVPVACMQGGRVHSLEGGLLRGATVDRGELTRLVHFAEEHGLYFQLYSGERLFTEAEAEFSIAYKKITDTNQEFVGKVSSFLSGYAGGIDKMLIIAEPGEISRLFSEYSVDSSFTHIQFVYSTPYFLEAIPVDSGKDVAMKMIADMYKVPLSEVAAVGDSNNDLPMIKAAGWGVAMGNAVGELKKAARAITESCDNDGLAVFLESVIF